MNYILTTSNSQIEVDAAEAQFGAPDVIVMENEVKSSARIKLLGHACIHGKYGDLTDYSRITPELLSSLSECQISFQRMVDRFNYTRSYNFSINSFYKHVAAWSHLLDNIDFVIFSAVPHNPFNWVLYHLARLRGIKCFMFYQMPIRPGLPVLKYAITDCMHHADSALLHKFDDSITMHVKTYMDGYSKDIRGSYTPFTRKKSPFNHLLWRISEARKNQPGKLITKALSRLFYMIFKLFENDPYETMVYRQYRISAKPPLDNFKKILYFPLHFQAEASTSPLGGRFVDQDLLIKMVASVLDKDTCLIVKDHPRRSRKLRYQQFFNDIASLPGVYLVPADDKGVDYIARADALLGITGTSCWEALFLGKPVLMAGTRIFEDAPHIFKVDSPESIRRALKSISKFNMTENTRDQYLQDLTPFLFPGYIAPADAQYSHVSLQESARLSMAVIKANLGKK
jgi:hypothetical protein